MVRWRIYLGLALTAASGLAAGCQNHKEPAAKAAPPATVAHPAKEGQLNTVVLTPEAEKSLGVKVAEVERRSVPRVRSYGGEITLPTNAVLSVPAPVGGTLQVPEGEKALPAVGAAVEEGRPLFTLVPHVLSQAEHVALAQATLQLAQARIDAEGQVKQAKVQVEAAQVTFERAERLYRDQAGTKKDLDDALAQVQLAQKSLDAALLRKSFADGMQLDTDRKSVKALEIRAPRQGILRATYVVPGELVPAGTALFEIVNTDTVWVKVPLYVGEVAEVAAGKGARVRNLADPPETKGAPAKPVPTPPTAQPQASAVDLYYELPNKDGKYRPGERVSVELPLKGEEQNLGLPWSAVLHDIQGGTWVYVNTAERTYVRRRVQVRYVVGDWAVLAEGPPAGAKVVTEGAAELFGTEFGFGN